VARATGEGFKGNAVRWAAPAEGPQRTFGNVDPIEELSWYDKKHSVTKGYR